MALSAKAKNGSLIVLDNLDVADGKTKVLAGQLEKLGLNKALFIDGDAVNVSFAKASSNLNGVRSEEHTYELKSLMRISYAVFCLKKKKKKRITAYDKTK